MLNLGIGCRVMFVFSINIQIIVRKLRIYINEKYTIYHYIVYCAVYQNKNKASGVACKVAFHVAPGMNTDIVEYDMCL